MSMKILITGAGGFIGGFIVEEALSRGYETWAGVRKTTSREHLSDPAIRFIDFNYGNKKILTDQLLSHKGEYGAWDYIVYNLGVTKCKNPDDFDRINYGFVKNFTEALIETEMVPKQFIMTSSLGAWGVGDEKNFTPIRPTDTPHPNTQYGKSKLKAERHLESLEGFPYVVMRPTGVYGPHERDYYLMMKSIKYGFDFIVGFKPQLITFIYVKDLVQAIFKAIDRGVVRRGYFLSEGKAYTSSQFRRYVATALGKRRVIPVKIPVWLLWVVSVIAEKGAIVLGKTSTLNRDKFRIMKQRNWICDISDAQNELGFSPQYSLERGVNECVKWYRENKWL